MRESSTIQAFIEEGRVKGLAEGRAEGKAEEARKIIVRQGRIRFGEPDTTVKARLEAISNLEKLELLVDRLVIASSWDELLNQASL